jgi:putative salt-induced outer membrane protein YdiY
MLESLWIVLHLLQAPALPPVQIGIPDDISGRLQPGIQVRTLLDPPAPDEAIVAPGTVPASRPARRAEAQERFLRAKSELSYVSTGGTAETQTIGSAGELLMTPPDWRLEVKAAYLRNKVNDEIRARRLTGQFRAARQFGERAEMFGRGVYLRNTFAGIQNSLDASAGITALLYVGEPHRLSIDSGFGYLTEDRTQGLGRDLPSVDFGIRHLWTFSRVNRFTNEAAIKTDIQRTSDWRLTHIAAVQAGLNSMLSIKVAHELNFRNEPVPGFTRADTVASASIVATF